LVIIARRDVAAAKHQRVPALLVGGYHSAMAPFRWGVKQARSTPNSTVCSSRTFSGFIFLLKHPHRFVYFGGDSQEQQARRTANQKQQRHPNENQ